MPKGQYPRKSTLEHHRDELIRLFNQGHTQGEIAEHFGCSQGNVSKFLRKLGCDPTIPDQPQKPLTRRQQSIIHGLLLGSAELKKATVGEKHSCLILRGAKLNHGWFTWQYAELSNLFRMQPRIYVKRFNKHNLPMLYAVSQQNQALNHIYDVWYYQSAKNMLQQIPLLWDSLTLATWFADTGGRTQSKGYYLRISGHSEDTHSLLYGWLHRFNLHPVCHNVTDQDVRFSFHGKNARAFRDKISQHIPMCRNSKLE